MILSTVPPISTGGILGITPSGTGSCTPAFDAGADSVIQRPALTGSPGATSAVGRFVSERMYERPAAFTAVTMRRTFPGMCHPPKAKVKATGRLDKHTPMHRSLQPQC